MAKRKDGTRSIKAKLWQDTYILLGRINNTKHAISRIRTIYPEISRNELTHIEVVLEKLHNTLHTEYKKQSEKL